MIGPSVGTVDNQVLHRPSAPSLQSRCEASARKTPPISNTPCTYDSRLPSAELLDSAPHPGGESRAEAIQCDEMAVEDPRNKIASRGDQVGDLKDAVATTQSVQRNSLPVGDSSLDSDERDKRPDEEGQADASSRSKQPPRPGRHSKIPSMHSRCLRPRPHAKSRSPERLPSVSVVIPVRRPDRLMESTTKNPPTRKRRRRQDANDNGDGENDPAVHDLIEDHSASVNRPNCEAAEHPRKRHRHAPRSSTATGSNPSLTDEAAGGCSNPRKTSK